MKTKVFLRVLAFLLALVMSAAMLPLQAFAYALEQQAAQVKSGVFTAGDGSEYAVLYNDYIKLYVNTMDGGFSIMPAAQEFDSAKPMSYASFQIDGQAYRYGKHYDGVTGTVSIAPGVNENKVLESVWQAGDFVISQIFAITTDTMHHNSYAVKVGYAAQYFGEGTAQIAGRITLDTQFTKEESVPVMLTDSAEHAVLVDCEAQVRPVPAVASISKEFIEDANNEAGTQVFADEPSKGYIVFGDNAFSAPDCLVFAELDNALGAGFGYTPTGFGLFDGSGADSAALLYWDSVSVAAGGQAAFGTNYGFYELEKGNPRFDVPAPVSFAAASAMSAEDSAVIYVTNLGYNIPFDWFDVTASVDLAEDIFGTDPALSAPVTSGVDFSIGLAFKPDTPQIIKDAVGKYNIYIGWDGGGEGGAIDKTLNVGELCSVDTAAMFSKRGDLVENMHCEWVLPDLSVTITPIIDVSSYATIDISSSGYQMPGRITGAADEVIFYHSPLEGRDTYIAKQAAQVIFGVEMIGLEYGFDSGSVHNPSLTWDYNNAQTLQHQADDLRGPLNYTYTFVVPNDAETGNIFYSIAYDPAAIVPRPINVRAYHAAQSSLEASIKQMIRDGISGEFVTYEQGIIWAMPGELVCLDPGLLAGYPGADLNIYNAGTKDAPGTTVDPVTGVFTMPNAAIDIVYENGTVYRVLTKVTGGEAAVSITSAHGADPQVGDGVYASVSNIPDDMRLVSITLDAADVSLETWSGSAAYFDMPSKDEIGRAHV